MNLVKIAIVASILLSIVFTARSQADISPGTRSYALGETGLGFQDIHAAYTNPAGLHGLDALSIQATVSRPFGIRELSSVQLAAASGLSHKDFLMGTVSSKGNSDFRQSRISLGYGRKLTNTLSIAIEFETLMMYIRGYGSAFAAGYGISLQHRPFNQLIIGVHLRNPVPVVAERVLIPKSTFSVGLSYLISELVMVNIEVFKDTQFKLRIKSGIEYKVHPVFTLRLGATTNPAQLHFGFGWDFKERFSIDFSVGYHTLLGVTPMVGFGYRAGK